jgi:hypothetical protein
MPSDMKIYTMRDFIRKNEAGGLSKQRIREILGELAAVAARYPEHNILLDFRETKVSDVTMVDILRTAMEVEKFKHALKNKVANVVPNDQDRVSIARKAEAAIQYKAVIDYKFFTDFEEAIDWLSDISE